MTGRWFLPGTPVSSANKTDGHDMAEQLLKVALNIITVTPPPPFYCHFQEFVCYIITIKLYGGGKSGDTTK